VTLRTRLLAWYSGVFFLCASVLVSAMYGVVTHKLRNDFFHYLEDEYIEAQDITRAELADMAELEQDIGIEVRGNKYFPMSYRLYDSRRKQEVLVVAPEWPDALTEPPLPDGDHAAPRRTRRRVTDRARDIVYFMTGRLDNGEHSHLVVEVGMSYKRVYKRLHSLRDALAIALGFSMIISVAGGWFLASRSLEPVDRIVSSLARVEAEDLSARLPEPRARDEMGRLALAINRMLARIEDAFESTKSFTADAAHELRTPLAALRCRLELAANRMDESKEAQEAVADSLAAVAELARLVEDLLLLAKLDAQQVLDEARVVNLARLLDDLEEPFRVLAEDRGVSLVFKKAPDCRVEGNSRLIRRLFSNLIENAVVYTPAGGSVDVSVNCDGGACRLAVTDTGVGIGPQDLRRIFERFHRADRSRARGKAGAGLGLSISQRIAELHGGSISVTSQEGAGSAFTVTLPACPARASPSEGVAREE
jgi:heavy metal sensor kinase